jgi:hypothetical protein
MYNQESLHKFVSKEIKKKVLIIEMSTNYNKKITFLKLK